MKGAQHKESPAHQGHTLKKPSVWFSWPWKKKKCCNCFPPWPSTLRPGGNSSQISPHPHPLNQAPPHRVHRFLSGKVLVRSRLDGADLVGGIDTGGGRRGRVEIAGAPCVVWVHLARGEGGDGGGVQHRVHVCRQWVRCVLHVPGALVGRRRGHRRGEGAILAHAGRSGSGQCCHLVLLVGRDEVVVVDRGAMERGCGPVTVVTARTQDTPLNHPLDTDTLLKESTRQNNCTGHDTLPNNQTNTRYHWADVDTAEQDYQTKQLYKLPNHQIQDTSEQLTGCWHTVEQVCLTKQLYRTWHTSEPNKHKAPLTGHRHTVEQIHQTKQLYRTWHTSKQSNKNMVPLTGHRHTTEQDYLTKQLYKTHFQTTKQIQDWTVTHC